MLCGILSVPSLIATVENSNLGITLHVFFPTLLYHFFKGFYFLSCAVNDREIKTTLSCQIARDLMILLIQTLRKPQLCYFYYYKIE